MEPALVEQIVIKMQEGVGQSFEFSLGEITPLMIARYARAINENAAIHFDKDAANLQGYVNVVAPANMLVAMVGWDEGAPEDALRPDGMEAEKYLPGMPALAASVRIMGGGEKMVFHREVTAGMSISQRTTLGGVELKESAGGFLGLLTYVIEFFDQSGEILMSTTRTMVAR